MARSTEPPTPEPTHESPTQTAPTSRAYRVKKPDAVATSPLAPGTRPSIDGERLPMPHERDEISSATASKPDDVIVQAKRDLDRGMVDTDLRATAGLDDAKRRNLLRHSK